jgi:hypothetical protein
MSFDKLKSNRQAAISKLVQAAEKVGGNKNFGDDRLWSPGVDKTGNGYAVIRFLPAREGDDLPWVRYWDHGFKGPTGRWYIENSLTSIGLNDPVAEINGKLWNSGNEKDKEVARERKRRLHYVSNVLVISDPANPQNEGKVFLYKYGKKIFDKIMDLMQPQFQDETPVNPFDFWTGANFKLKIRNVEGYRNYDKSEFDKATPLFGGDEARLRDTYESLHPLAPFIDPANYKSYDELRRKLIDVLGEESVNGQESVSSTPVINKPSTPSLSKVASAPQIKSEEAPKPAAEGGSDDAGGDDDDETLSYFAKLARS